MADDIGNKIEEWEGLIFAASVEELQVALAGAVGHLRQALDQLKACRERLETPEIQIGLLADYLLEEYGSEIKDESSCEMAIRLLKELKACRAQLKECQGMLSTETLK